ncbi:MAG: Glu-tRNA(Gln) amidotransferase subunit GatE [Candidatus Aenigmarchaeota archaeon]|nr:Glu-tRNA(Gln) amidotransferase subunit GatE [Candidatus Aenigmarchaeota archaeon]
MAKGKYELRCGLEIHQRLHTKKLFCNCESTQTEEPFLEVRRQLRPVAGELGDVDPAALHEALRGRHFLYQISQKESCLVELDCEPPHEINLEALDVALSVCKLLQCTIPEEIHVMRKTVIDGSNTGGFQRTAVVGMDGKIKVGNEIIEIDQIALEEESARIESKSEHETIYRLSGLGIPLVEITTGVIDDADKLQKVAEHIGLLLRSFDVQRGIGSIRQDVNVSIANGARVEIKGFQELEKMAELVKNEAKRQQDLLNIMNKLIKRKASVSGAVKDVTKYFGNTGNILLKDIVNNKGRVFAFLLRNFDGMMTEECGDRTLGKELAGYAQAYGIGGIIHTDEDLGRYKLRNEFDLLKKEFKAKERDSIVILAGMMPDVRNAVNAVYERALHLLSGVPEETRFSDGIGSKFARPLPGKARMYPETDVPPIIAEAPKKLPKTMFEKESDLKKRLPAEMAEQMIRSHRLPLYEKLAERHDPVLVANTLLSTMKDLSRRGFDVERIGEEELSAIFSMVKKGKITRQAIPEALAMIAQGKSINDIEKSFGSMPEIQLRDIVRSVIKSNPNANEGALMGIVMNKARGRVEGKIVAKIVREEMGKGR